MRVDLDSLNTLLAYPKAQTWKSAKYLQWVREQPCSGCGFGSDDAHHIIGAGLGGTMARKTHDLMAMPMCRVCHGELHRDVKGWERIHGSQSFYVLKTINNALELGVLS